MKRSIDHYLGVKIVANTKVAGQAGRDARRRHVIPSPAFSGVTGKRVRLCALLMIMMSWLPVARAIDVIIPSPPQLAAKGYLLIDAHSHKVIADHNSGQRLPPASLSKIMTSYIVAGEIKRGSVSLDEEVDVSVKAWRMEGSRMFIREGTRVQVEDLLRGVVVQSGNDASVALAEHIAGSEEGFVEVMNQMARRLGMSDTHFMNVTGLPDEDHFTTARDLATLTMALIRDYPEHYALYSEKYFTYNAVRQMNRNALLWRDKTVDGVKTGHTEAAGYCLVSSAERDGMRLIAVVMGASSQEARAAESQKLITYGFRYFKTHRLYEAEETLKRVRVWLGADESLALGLQAPVIITIPRGTRDSLNAEIKTDSVLKAPFEKGAELGHLSVKLDAELVYEAQLVALASVGEAGFFSRMWDTLALFFLQLFGGDPLVA
jgi:D-alanyl-D-alanine carboxypeptidase (penicillin-binding protein 5/6)